jgi:hypothetical protein
MFTLTAMTGRWTNDDYFRFDIMLGLMKGRVRGVRRLFTEEEREGIARTIVDHLRLSRWRWWREERSVGPGLREAVPAPYPYGATCWSAAARLR